LIGLTEIFNWFLLALPKIFIHFDWASVRLPVYSGEMKAIYIIYFAPLLVLTVLLNRWNPFELSSKFKVQSPKFIFRSSAVSLAVLFFLIVFHPFSAPAADGRLKIDFLDVGQGDAALVTFPNGETLLVDGGGKVNYARLKNENADETEAFEPDTQTIGETVVSEFLWQRGLSEIDYILATHADADHFQGLKGAAKNFRVRAAFLGRMSEDDEDFAEFLEILRKRKIETIILSRGDVFTVGGVKIEVLFPEADNSPQAVSDNNNSLVLRLTFGAKSFLLTGDIEKETENRLAQTPESLKADVVKVAHHGSRTSSIENFVKATKARFAVISVGRKSPFGHPHAEVVERWQDSGAKILKTGERGTISISTDGSDLQINTFLK
jgi:competence protein ComEC